MHISRISIFAVTLSALTIFFSVFTSLGAIDFNSVVFTPFSTGIHSYEIWRLITAPLVNRWYLLVLYIPLLFTSIAFVESFWGTVSFLKYLLIGYLSSCVMVLFCSIVLFALSGLNIDVLETPLHGCLPLLAIFSVAAAYLRPEVSPTIRVPLLKPFSFAWLRLQYLPFIFLVLSLLFAVTGGIQGVLFGFWVLASVLSPYLYLRYLRKNPLLPSCLGDRGPHFAFSLLSPPPFRPFFRIVSHSCSKFFRLPPTDADHFSEDVAARLGTMSNRSNVSTERLRQQAMAMVELEYQKQFSKSKV
ncbi:hypothetical protein GEMRC1_006954 [Eukaryota sp. GEM-RC1]